MVLIFTFPSSINEHLAVVPPISKEIILFSPISFPSSAAPKTPLVGPDSIIVKGVAFVASNVSMPPLDCITYGIAEKFEAFSFFERLSKYFFAIGFT